MNARELLEELDALCKRGGYRYYVLQRIPDKDGTSMLTKYQHAYTSGNRTRWRSGFYAYHAACRIVKRNRSVALEVYDAKLGQTTFTNRPRCGAKVYLRPGT